MTNKLKQVISRFRPTKSNGLIVAAFLFSGGIGQVFAQPRITIQPSDQSVSLGAPVTMLISASSSAPPLSYQWRFKDTDIAAGTNRNLLLTNVQIANAGGYSVVVTDSSGSTNSRVAGLEVDSAFTMITVGPVVTDTSLSVGVAWGDYDNDGYPDLLIGNAAGVPGFLYRNKGDGTFERVPSSSVAGLGLGAGAWADYDNDGWLDFYTVTARDLGVGLFHNEGNGTFLRLTNAAVVGAIIGQHGPSASMAWGDYDGDGFVDVFVANGV